MTHEHRWIKGGYAPPGKDCEDGSMLYRCTCGAWKVVADNWLYDYASDPAFVRTGVS